MSKQLLTPNQAFAIAAAAGADIEALSRCASEIVVFGSWTIGAETPKSDVDLLCVGHGHRRKCDNLDIIWITERQAEKESWLGSELANHIAAFGVWVYGQSRWIGRIHFSDVSVAEKADAIKRRANAVDARWDHLAPRFRRFHATLIRRDLQRFRLLREDQPVPPTRWLDEAWQKVQSPAETIGEWMDSKEFRHTRWNWLRFSAATRRGRAEGVSL